MVAASSSTITTTASTGCHVFKVSGYSHLKLLLGTGNAINSAKFKAAGHSWRINVYPNGKSKRCAPGCISLYLILAGESKQDVHAKLHFSFVRHGNLTETPYGGRKTDTPVTFKCNSSAAWGYDNVGTSEELTNPEYLKDDTILIRCDITVLNMPVVQRLVNLQTPPEYLKLNETFTAGYIPISHDAVPLPSASAVDATASTGRHVLKVSSYSETSLLVENGKCINSVTFNEAGHTWRIQYYPNGIFKENAGKISLFLELADESTNVHSKFRFSLVPHGELPATPLSGRSSSACCFMVKGKRWGYSDFMAREELEKSEYLKDDTILIQCHITVLNKPVVKRHDLETLELLCDCSDHMCENLHVDNTKAAAASSKPQSRHVLKRMLLGCFHNRSKSSQKPAFKLE